jgi:hypothetical protein
MTFSYEGFTHRGNTRCFLFRGGEDRTDLKAFSIEVDLPLFVQNRVSYQDGPSFCLELLARAFSVGPIELEKCHSYRVVGADFLPLVLARQRREAEKILKRKARIPTNLRTANHLNQTAV